MDMEEANAATAQGDLADVVARANAMAYTTHHQTPPPPPPAAAAAAATAAAAHMSHRYVAGGQIMMIPCEEERRRPMSNMGCGRDAVMFEGSSVTADPYLSPAMAPRPAGYGLPQHHQQLAVQISQHACCGRDVVTGAAAAAAGDDGDDGMRISPPAHHQMIKRKNEVRKVVCIPAPPVTSGRAGGGGEVIPSDLWAWRKYGQKPIKGSPYPRGYYRCSSSKGCMARKQVERSRSDPNMLVITYTAEHDHPWPMQRNVLAGYARAHTHASAKKQHKNVATSSSSSSNDIHHTYSAHPNQQNAVAGGGQPANMPAADGGDTVGAGEGGVMYEHCNGVHPDEVFSELEELEPDNAIINANIYSRGVSYEWHKF